MNRLFRKKHTLPPQGTSPPPPSILNIAEVLEIILSYLDNITIRRTCFLVCRQWYQLSLNRVPREVRWDWRWKRNRVDSALKQLAGAHRLVCTCISIYGFGEADEAQYKIMLAINQQATIYQNMVKKWDEQTEQQQQQHRGGWNQWWGRQGNAFLGSYSPLREVELYAFQQHLEDKLTGNLFHFPATLTSLKLTGGVYSGTRFWVHQLFTDCPLLEVFHAGSGGPILIIGSWVPPDYDRTKSLRLRSLVLQNVELDQANLEDLLTITRLLQELKLIDLLPTTGLVFENVSYSHYDWDRLYQCLSSLALPLRTLQFTVHRGGNMSPVQVRQRMIELCPNNAFEWSFAPADVSLDLLRELSAVHNNITTLELCIPRFWPHNFTACTIGRSLEVLRLLHQYLCDSPNLIKLKCIRGAILLEELDLFDRAMYTDLALGCDRDWVRRVRPSIPPKDKNKKIWACRNLRSLEVQVHSHGHEQLIWPVQSRILFGYISNVCPQLEELDIRLSSYCSPDSPDQQTRRTLLHIQLGGGLCLLSKMEHLRVLKIDRGSGGSQWLADDIQQFDINWIVPSELRREKNRKQRRLAIEQWKQDLETEQQLEAMRVAPASPQQPISGGRIPQQQEHEKNGDELTLGRRRYEELENSLSGLGLLSEVKKVVESMDSPGFRCFPCLERLSFGGAFEQGPAVEIKRVFPRWYQGG